MNITFYIPDILVKVCGYAALGLIVLITFLFAIVRIYNTTKSILKSTGLIWPYRFYYYINKEKKLGRNVSWGYFEEALKDYLKQDKSAKIRLQQIIKEN